MKSVNLKFILFMIGFVSVYLVQYTNRQLNVVDPQPRNLTVPKGYLVYGPNCRMASLDPFAGDVMKLFSKQKLPTCSKIDPLTEISHNRESNIVKLVFHEKNLAKYLNKDDNLKCYYQEVIRSGNNATADDKYSLSHAVYFNTTVALPEHIEFIIVHCKSLKPNNKEHVIYANAHAVIQKYKTRKKIENYKRIFDKQRPLSVLMVGIDSISRLNLIRAMPLTHKYLNDTGWFELKGYNKVDDNTFPNIMAILTGYDIKVTLQECNPTKVGGLDSCPFIWNYFRDNGYVTAYAEDEGDMSTFNRFKLGFLKQPVDHYFRYFGLAAEKNLKIKQKHGLSLCLGYQTYADYIYQFAIDFAKTYNDDPFFGLFWMNTFSHNDVSDPSIMDSKSRHYLEELDKSGVLNTSAVVFFSDHGIRFGPVLELYTGFMEERLPFIYIWLPEWFRKQHPLMVENLRINRDRLTSPYDLHMTLKHILELSGRIDNLPNAISCPKCQSLFEEVPWERSCNEVNIDSHWCTCLSHTDHNSSDPIIRRAVEFQLNFINSDVEKRTNFTNICAKLSLSSIMSAKKVVKLEKNYEYIYNDYLIVFNVSPSRAKFQATLRHLVKSDSFEILGSVSRLDMYGSQSSCIKTDYLKKYCYCLKKKSRRK